MSLGDGTFRGFHVLKYVIKHFISMEMQNLQQQAEVIVCTNWMEKGWSKE